MLPCCWWHCIIAAKNAVIRADKQITNGVSRNFTFLDNKIIIGSFLLITMYLFYLIKFNRSIEKYVKEKCITRTSMACFGGAHRRNVFTSDEIMRYEIKLILFMYIYNTTIFIFQFYSDEAYSYAHFITHNIFWFGFVDIYNGVIVPYRHLQLVELIIRLRAL